MEESAQHRSCRTWLGKVSHVAFQSRRRKLNTKMWTWRIMWVFSAEKHPTVFARRTFQLCKPSHELSILVNHFKQSSESTASQASTYSCDRTSVTNFSTHSLSTVQSALPPTPLSDPNYSSSAFSTSHRPPAKLLTTLAPPIRANFGQSHNHTTKT